MKKSLILGSSSFIGSHLCNFLDKEKYIGTYNKNHVINSIKFDSVKDNLNDLNIKWNEFENAIILLGDINPDHCFKYP